MKWLGIIIYAVWSVALVFGQSRAEFPSPDSYGHAIEVRTDIAFGESEQQKFDLFLPAGAAKAPVVVCWFGGAFWGSDRSQMANLAAYFASQGFAAINPGYFLGTKDGSRAAWPQAVFDAKAAVRFLRAYARNLKIDPDRIVALGFSSGAYLAMMVGFTAHRPELEGDGVALSESSKVAAVIEVAGVCDRRRAIGLPLALLGKGYEEKYHLRIITSPVIYITAQTVPVYILHGNHDHVADVSSAVQLAAALKSVGVRYELRIVDADHDPFSLGEVQSMVDWLRKTLRTEASVGH